MSKFADIEDSEWWNTTSIIRRCQHIRNDAEAAGHHAKLLRRFQPTEEVRASLAAADLALAEAHLAVKVAIQGYEKPVMQAAE